MKRVLTAGERVKLARSLERPRAKEYIEGIFDDFVELAGDGASGEDKSMICGIAKYRELSDNRRAEILKKIWCIVLECLTRKGTEKPYDL